MTTIQATATGDRPLLTDVQVRRLLRLPDARRDLGRWQRPVLLNLFEPRCRTVDAATLAE